MHRIILTIVIALLLVPIASARNYKADIEITPPVIGQVNTMSGCGYQPSAFLKIYVIWYIDERTATGYDFNTTTDSNGCFSAQWTPNAPGEWELYAYQYNKPGNTLQTQAKIEIYL